MNELLKIDNIQKYYGARSSLTKALDGLSFSVAKQEFVAIMGASGSGKTTLLNCISTIDRVTAGHIYLGDIDITKLKGNKLDRFRREELGFIFQDFNLLDTLTGYENIALALSIQNVPYKDSKSSRMLLEKFNYLNQELAATILMVTHDAFTASYASRVIFIKDGKIFSELHKGDSTRKEFFDKIIDVVTVLGGDLNDAL